MMNGNGGTKERFRMGTVGESHHGKTTLTRAISSTVGRQGSSAGNVLARLLARLRPSRLYRVRYETSSCVIEHVDASTERVGIRRLLRHPGGLDGVFLVIDAGEGMGSTALEQLKALKHAGVRVVVVAVNKVDRVTNEAMLERVERQVAVGVAGVGFDQPVRLFRVSALCALRGEEHWRERILELIETTATLLAETKTTDQSPSTDDFTRVEAAIVAGIQAERDRKRWAGEPAVVSRGGRVEVIGPNELP